MHSAFAIQTRSRFTAADLAITPPHGSLRQVGNLGEILVRCVAVEEGTGRTLGIGTVEPLRPHIGLAADRFPNTVAIQVFVRKSMRGRGVGRALVEALLASSSAMYHAGHTEHSAAFKALSRVYRILDLSALESDFRGESDFGCHAAD